MISTDSPLQFIINVAAFIVAIGVLVAVHEFGHFWVARKLGIRVLRFSIGFGKPLYRRVIGKDPLTRRRTQWPGWSPYPARYRDPKHYSRMY